MTGSSATDGLSGDHLKQRRTLIGSGNFGNVSHKGTSLADLQTDRTLSVPMRITPLHRDLPPTPRVTRFYPLRYISIDDMI